MKAAPRSVRWLWGALGCLLTLGLPAYGHFVLTGSYDLLVLFFRHVGGAFFILMASAETFLAHQARRQFAATEPMHATWTMVFLGACCRLTGAALVQVLSVDIAWNPLVMLKVFDLVRSRTLRDIGLVVGGPAAMAFLAVGLRRLIVLKRRLGISSALTGWDRLLIAGIVVFTAHQIFEMSVMLRNNRSAANLTQVLLWLSDPLLALLLIQAVSIRRWVLNLGDGLVSRCWGMMAAGVAFTSAGDAVLWAESYGWVPAVLSPIGWFVWFFAATAYACAPCYQLEATRQAHEGSYSVFFTRG
jgi:hypothetical protein